MNALILRLKNSIDQKILDSIDKNLMGQYHFVPISVKDNFLFVAVSKNSNKDEINALLKKTFQQSIKFMLVGDDDLKELLGSFVSTDAIASVPTGGTAPETQQPKPAEQTAGSANGKLGEMLVSKGVLSEVDLMKALAASKRKNVPIGSTLFEMGLISLDQLKNVLHDQSGYDLVSTEQLVDQKKFVNILPEDFIRANKVIPISSDGKTLVLGVVKPIKMDILKEIIYLTGQNPKQLLMTHYEFENSLNTFFSAQKKQTEEIIEQIKTETLDSEEEATLWEQVDAELQDSTGSVAKFVNQIITNGIDNKVSDIHIEPRLSGYIVRYRKDGMLQKVLDVPAKVETSVIARFKVMARMNIAENRRPQDGTFSISYRDCSYDFRINTLPVSGAFRRSVRPLGCCSPGRRRGHPAR